MNYRLSRIKLIAKYCDFLRWVENYTYNIRATVKKHRSSIEDKYSVLHNRWVGKAYVSYPLSKGYSMGKLVSKEEILSKGGSFLPPRQGDTTGRLYIPKSLKEVEERASSDALRLMNRFRKDNEGHRD